MKVLNREACAGLDHIRNTFGLSETELAALFGAQRQSVAEWREKGIPPGRRASVERLVDLANVLDREVIGSRIPEIVRTPDDWLDGKTILDVIMTQGVEPVYSYLHRLLSYTGI